MSVAISSKTEPLKEEDPIKLRAWELYMELKKDGFSQKEILDFISYFIETITEDNIRGPNRNLISV